MDLEQTLLRYPEQRCETASGVLSWREAGSGEPIVLLHGISSEAASWVLQLQGLEPDFRVIAWNAPGYGSSTPLASETPLATDYASVLGDLVDMLSLERFTLVGHSLGALIAVAYASSSLDRLQRLVLLSPARGYAEADEAERRQKYNRRMDMLERLGPSGLARERSALMVSADAPPRAVAWVARNIRRINPIGYRQAARMLADEDIARYAQRYTQPVAVFSGVADRITPVEKCRLVAGEFEVASYESLPGLGHALYVEDPVRINARLRHQAALQLTSAQWSTDQ